MLISHTMQEPLLRFEFLKFRILEILNFHPWVCQLLLFFVTDKFGGILLTACQSIHHAYFVSLISEHCISAMCTSLKLVVLHGLKLKHATLNPQTNSCKESLVNPIHVICLSYRKIPTEVFC